MRIPRSIQLHETSNFIHKFWRCHNKEFLLKSDDIKHLYMNCTKYALQHESIDSNVKLQAYCLMSNHTHMHLTYEKSSLFLSEFMRISHAKFGAVFNKIFDRKGKVACERPKTPVIENPEHCMRVHFYIEANPIRAGMRKLENLRGYKYSSYRFYAFGIKDKWTELLDIPKWYLELGRTAIERQRKYRRLFREYLENDGKLNPNWMFERFIGGAIWKDKMADKIKDLARDYFKSKKPEENTT